MILVAPPVAIAPALAKDWLSAMNIAMIRNGDEESKVAGIKPFEPVGMSGI
jgi:hypothetical protein